MKPVGERIAAAVKRRFGEALEVVEGLPQLEALAALNERSVCRRYRGDPVPEALVRLLCATARSAPTKSDLDPSVHYAYYEFEDVAKARAVPGSEAIKPLIAEFDRLWGKKVLRTREVVRVVQRVGA